MRMILGSDPGDHDTTGMWLVFNTRPNAQPATETGVLLGGGEYAWINCNDAVFRESLKSGIFHLLNDGKVEKDNKPAQGRASKHDEGTKPRRGRPPKKSAQS